ncbi:MAG: type II secretion system protein [Candidatus Sacchiramonaceae bacterium]|nr:type II secretion system protein [Candidatus Saccharimonadaceae bacterium]
MFRNNNKSGFTIIAVVLVLAIAGLIFLMVFIALPALQRNQRDAQRKNDMARVKDAIERYKANNSGAMPLVDGYMSWSVSGAPAYGNFWNYMGKPGDTMKHRDTFKDPDGRHYFLNVLYASIDRDGWKPSRRVSEYSSVYVHLVGNPSSPWPAGSLGFQCNEDGSLRRVPGRNKYTIQIPLENGGVYCIDG